MKRYLLKLIYLSYPKLFQDFLVEDLIGLVPKQIQEPSVAFLAKGKETLTKYFLYQAYIIQRRAIADVGNAERFHGMLVVMKFMLSLLETAQPREAFRSLIEDKREDPVDKIDQFTKGMKDRIKPN